MADGDLLDAYIDVYFTAFKYIGDLISAPMKADKLSFEQFMIMRDLDAGHELNLSAIARNRRVTNAAAFPGSSSSCWSAASSPRNATPRTTGATTCA